MKWPHEFSALAGVSVCTSDSGQRLQLLVVVEAWISFHSLLRSLIHLNKEWAFFKFMHTESDFNMSGLSGSSNSCCAKN
jgi:hypothetical protein